MGNENAIEVEDKEKQEESNKKKHQRTSTSNIVLYCNLRANSIGNFRFI